MKFQQKSPQNINLSVKSITNNYFLGIEFDSWQQQWGINLDSICLLLQFNFASPRRRSNLSLKLLWHRKPPSRPCLDICWPQIDFAPACAHLVGGSSAKRFAGLNLASEAQAKCIQ
ncbi:hypothetical protein RchiOBHm_Chr2g0118621 [Rosa chinensis]|uniref:Uncharacterized protein n=1 Tax=Rosa chinensis TaxID=74649 RepID=A0A2P6RRT7_ROSCH|nr:hypothetical protein RchiOBHm_Chr2g0118621 [Rosa chinensis]